MAIVSRTILKSYFETGDTPTQAQFIDLIDTLLEDESGARIKTAYEAEADTNALTNALLTILNNTSGVNTGDQTLTGLDYEPTKGADDNYVTDAEKVIIGNTSGTNTGDQTLTGLDYEPTGTAQGIMDTHETTHPIPTTRDSRNQVAGTYSTATGVEDNADVTDAANVTAAGALMDSELTSIAHVKALNQSVISGATPTFTNTNFTEATDKNYVTDAQQTIIGNTSNTNSGDNAANTTYANDYRAANFVAGTDYATKTGSTATLESFIIPIGAEADDATTGTAKYTFTIPYAFTITAVYGDALTNVVTSLLTIDVNDDGTTIMSTNKITIDIGEATSRTAATAPGITAGTIAADSVITIDVDTFTGTGAAGTKITLVGYQT